MAGRSSEVTAHSWATRRAGSAALSHSLRRVAWVTDPTGPEPPSHIAYGVDGARDALTDSGHLTVVVGIEDQIRLLNRKLGFDDPEGDADVR